MKREFLVKQINDALELVEQMKTDRMLRLVYSDIDWDRYIQKRRDALSDCWVNTDSVKLPF